MQRARPRETNAVAALAALIIISGLFAFRPTPVYACSCANDSAWVRLERADAAFVGRLVEAPDRSSGTGEGYFTFEVEQTVKGEPPDVLRVRSPLSGDACGFEITVGIRKGIFLRESDGEWAGGLCGQIEPEELLAAAEPLPEPDGSGPIAALAGMRTPEGRTVALDAEGRTLAYGGGEGQVFAYAVCPASRTVVEYASVPGEQGLTYRVGVRDLQGFHVVREIVAPGLLTYTTDVACLDELGDEILLFEPGRSGGLPAARLVRVDGTDVEIVAEFEEQADCESPAAIDVPLGSVYFTGALDCRTLYRYDIADDRLEELAQIPKVAEGDAFDAITLSPDGRYLAIEAHPGPRIQTFRIFMLDLSSTPGDYIEAVFRGTYEPAGIHWLGDDRLLVTGTDGSLEGAILLTPDLEVIETVANVRAGLAGVHDDQIYVLEQSGRLVVMPASGGSARELRQFADPSIRAFVTLDASVTIDPSAPRSDIPVAVAESSSDAGEGDTMLPSGSRILGIGLLAMLLGTGSALIYWLTRRRVVRKVAP